jgi:hypothetical protein
MAILKAVGVVMAVVSSAGAGLDMKPATRAEAARALENWRRFISHLHALLMG